MSISSEIARIGVNVENSYTAVNSKGGILPSVRNSANLPNAINSIQKAKPEQSKTLTLGAAAPSAVTPDSGKVLSSVLVTLDTSVIKAENIKKDVVVLGITGTHEGGIKLASIAVTTPPTKTAYKAGETFSTTGMVVTATYSNGATMNVTDFAVEPSTPLTIDLTGVTIRYSEGGVTKTATQTISVTRTALSVPTQSGSLTYNGGSQSPTWSNYDSAKMTLGGTTSGTNAGSYNATFALKDTNLYEWSDGTTTAKTVAWSIAKAAGSLSLSKSSVTLNSTTKSTTVTVTRAGDGVISAVSNDTSVATVSVSGNTLTINSVNDTSGEATITVSVAEGTNHLAPSSKTIAVSAEFLPAKKALNDTSWADISTVAAAGQAANYWAVGDRKAVALSGTVGTQSVSGTYYAYIIGIAHNGASNTIDFGTFKTALSGGTDICLIDSKYDNYSTNGTKYFNMNHSSNTNSGGWKGCDLRYDVLGSTKTKGSDAVTNTATSPVSSTLMAALPSELRAVMKPMTIYTDNTGGGTDTASNVTSSVDYLPLLAEFEIFGTRSYANSAEKNYQKQYAYYSAGNSKVKYQHSSTGSAAFWWERSPFYYTGSSFCLVTTNGSAGSSSARYSLGLAPAFRV